VVHHRSLADTRSDPHSRKVRYPCWDRRSSREAFVGQFLLTVGPKIFLPCPWTGSIFPGQIEQIGHLSHSLAIGTRIIFVQIKGRSGRGAFTNTELESPMEKGPSFGLYFVLSWKLKMFGNLTFGLLLDDDVLEKKSWRNPTCSSELLVVEDRTLEGVNAVDSDTTAIIVRRTCSWTMSIMCFNDRQSMVNVPRMADGKGIVVCAMYCMMPSDG
jgi:hypothetical protein